MARRKGVTVVVDENFFNSFERERKKEQEKLRQRFGGMFNLTQKNFTAMLAAKKFRFQVPRQTVMIRRKRRRKLR